MTRETRTATNIEVRAEEADDGHYVTLQAIKPGVVDDYGSLWKANAFDESLGQRLPVLCWGHDWTNPLGPGVGFEATRQGPRIKFKFSDFDAVPEARRAFAQVNDGTIKDCSVGFANTQRRAPTDKERETYPGVREVIEKAQLDEVSLVLRGAVPGAKVLAVRSARTATGGIVDMDAVLDIARKKAAGELTDAEAKAAIELLSAASPAQEAPAEEPPAGAEAASEADEQDSGAAATIDDALAAEALIGEALARP